MEIYFVLMSVAFYIASAFRGNTITAEVTSDSGVDCRSTVDVGTCEGQEEAWYYVHEDNRCAFFVYSGCGGNGNRFTSKGNCEAACMKTPRCPESDCPESCTKESDGGGCYVCACTKAEAEQVCKEAPQRGYCRALQYKWAWDAKARKCIQFLYGGCGGNENNFDTEEMCSKICRKL
ncbi:kunitz-type U19-barytoxin-Tl1a-like [Macrobrachium nipponense]|uniref:kunitz-type U19-barytoxin-Tl1a-like n=1 Tax=Macrobrachium nipponense TaxID=159736 RepID=UPI0030C7A82B